MATDWLTIGIGNPLNEALLEFVAVIERGTLTIEKLNVATFEMHCSSSIAMSCNDFFVLLQTIFWNFSHF